MPAPSPRGSVLSLGLVLAGALALPMGLRAVNRMLPDEGVKPSYLPSVETPRPREPFDETAAADLREARPDFFIIGDSMAGTRIDPRHLSQIVEAFGMKLPSVTYLMFCNNHMIHHRGQLTTYIRPAGGKVPAMYGPSFDEKMGG